MPTAKQQVLELLSSLPDDCSLDEIHYRLYLQRKVEAGIRDIESGNVVSQEQAEEEVQRWFTSSGREPR
jgi:predicted transcriptional regulator